MKKLLWILVAVALVGWILYGNVKQQETQSNEKRTVYAVLPLSGAIAKSGQEYQQALNVYQKSHNTSGLNLVYVDSAFNPSQAVTALQGKIVSEDKPLVIVTGTTIALSILDIVNNKNGFVLISGGAIPKNASRNNFWNFSSGNGLGMIKIADYISKKYNSVAMLYPNSDYGILTYNTVKDNLKNNVKFVFSEKFDNNVGDVRTLVQKVIKDNPESVIVTGAANPVFISIFKTLKEMDYKGEILADLTFQQPAVFDGLQKSTDGITFLTLDGLLDNPKTKEGRQFKSEFKAENITPSFAHVEAYNMALFLEKLAQIESIDQSIIKGLKHMNTVAGSVSFLENGDTLFQYELAQVKNGKIVPVEE